MTHDTIASYSTGKWVSILIVNVLLSSTMHIISVIYIRKGRFRIFLEGKKLFFEL